MAQGPPERYLPQRRQAQDIAASYATAGCGPRWARPGIDHSDGRAGAERQHVARRERDPDDSVWLCDGRHDAAAKRVACGPAWSVEARMVRGVVTRPRFCGEPPAYPAFAGAADDEAPTRGYIKARGWAWVGSLPSRFLLQVQRFIFVDNNVIDNGMQAGGEWTRPWYGRAPHGAAPSHPPRRPRRGRTCDRGWTPSDPDRGRTGLAQTTRPTLLRSVAHRGRCETWPRVAGRSRAQRHARRPTVVAAPHAPMTARTRASHAPARGRAR